MMSFPKTLAKFGPPRNQTKVLMRATLFTEFEPLCQVMGIFVKFWLFYDARSPNMVMSRDPRSKF